MLGRFNGKTSNSLILRLQNIVKEFFTKGQERSLEAKKNIAYSLLYKSVSIISNVILVPLTINYMNPVRYGIWLTVSSLMVWLSFLDIGLGNGLRNKFAESKALNQFARARIYVSTTYAALVVIFSVIWVVFFFINRYLDWSMILNAPPAMKQELSEVALVLFTFVCLQFVLKVVTTIVTADQKPAKTAFIDMAGQLLILLVIFILSRSVEASLLVMAYTIGFAPVLVLLISSIYYFRGEYREFLPSIKTVRFSFVHDIMKLGFKFFIIQISVIVIYQTTNLIIAQICGPESVSVYNIAYKYFNVVYFLFCIINLPFWSAFTDAYTKNDYAWMRKTLKNLEKIALGSVIMILILLALSPLVYKLWIGEVLQVRFSVSVLVTVYFITNIVNSLYVQIINGIGKIRLQLYVMIFGALINIPLAILLGHVMGMEGVILATILVNLLVVAYAPIQVHAILNKKARGILLE